MPPLQGQPLQGRCLKRMLQVQPLHEEPLQVQRQQVVEALQGQPLRRQRPAGQPQQKLVDCSHVAMVALQAPATQAAISVAEDYSARTREILGGQPSLMGQPLQSAALP